MQYSENKKSPRFFAGFFVAVAICQVGYESDVYLGGETFADVRPFQGRGCVGWGPGAAPPAIDCFPFREKKEPAMDAGF